jgi:hypothetical protein
VGTPLASRQPSLARAPTHERQSLAVQLEALAPCKTRPQCRRVAQSADGVDCAFHGRLLVIDEAHLLQPDQLEEIRLLTNAEMDSASPFPAPGASCSTGPLSRSRSFAGLDLLTCRFVLRTWWRRGDAGTAGGTGRGHRRAPAFASARSRGLRCWRDSLIESLPLPGVSVPRAAPSRQ